MKYMKIEIEDFSYILIRMIEIKKSMKNGRVIVNQFHLKLKKESNLNIQ